jgi:hypothetical protein
VSNLYRRPSIDASYQVLVQFAKRFQKRRFFFEIDQSETRIACFFTGPCHFQLSNIRITKRSRLAGDDDYLRGATSINHQVALHANFKIYSDEVSNLYRRPSIDASYQVLVQFAKQFQRRRFFLEINMEGAHFVLIR